MRFHSLRWGAVVAQTIIVAGLPFVSIGGQSALRFDVPTMRLHFFGATLWVGEFYLVLLAALIFFLAIIAFTLVLGRVWCGWACPQTALGEYIALVRRILRRRVGDAALRRAVRSVGAHSLMALISVFVSANLIWYFISPYEMLPALFTWNLGPVTKWIFVVNSAALFLNFEFLGQRFCATVCPYSKMQGVLLDKNSLVIAFDAARADECRGCERCVTVCPTGMDIKAGPAGPQVECINCALCIDACAEMMAKRGKGPLVGYVFGEKGGRIADALTWKAAAFIAGIAALSAMLVYAAVSRPSFTAQVSHDRGELYRVTADGTVVNSYEVRITNRAARDAAYSVAVEGLEGASVTAAGPLTVRAGGQGSFRVAVGAAKMPGAKSARIRITVTDKESGETVSKEAGFLFP